MVWYVVRYDTVSNAMSSIVTIIRRPFASNLGRFPSSHLHAGPGACCACESFGKREDAPWIRVRGLCYTTRCSFSEDSGAISTWRKANTTRKKRSPRTPVVGGHPMMRGELDPKCHSLVAATTTGSPELVFPTAISCRVAPWIRVEMFVCLSTSPIDLLIRAPSDPWPYTRGVRRTLRRFVD